MKNIFKHIYSFMTEKTEDSKHLLLPFGVLVSIGYPLFYVLNKLSNSYNYDNLSLRLLAVLFGTLLIFHNKWPARLEKFKALYWYFSVTFVLPYFFTFMLLKNPSSVEWQLNSLITITLVILLFDWLSVACIIIFGIMAGSLTYYIVDPNPHLPQYLVALINTTASLLVYCVLFSYKKEKIQHNQKINLKISKLVNKRLEKKVLERTLDLEQKVSERTFDLEKALAVKTEFLNNMSHEIRTPIQGFTAISRGVVDNWSSLNEDKKFVFIKSVADSAERLGSLVSNLLDFSKFNNNEMILDLREMDLRESIKNIIDESNILYPMNKDIKVNFFEGNAVLLVADNERINQVLRNLLFNAIKFTPKHGTIDILLKSSEDEAHFSITDNGIGIPSEELKMIFEPFTQSSRSKTGAGGTGLGLSIAKKIIELHHGKIWAENNISNGASFHFTLPIRNYTNPQEAVA